MNKIQPCGGEMANGDAVVSIRDRLLKERHALLDLSTRNRLLNTPLRTKNNRAIEIVDEKSEEVFRLLVSGKSLAFLPGVALSEAERAELEPDDDITGGIPQPEDESVDERGVAKRHSDSLLQTRLTSTGLQKRLFDIWYDAHTLEQEQGVNILYLAIGLLRWFDSDNSDIARHAPLVLLPVKLDRTTAADKFKLRWREEAPSPNLTLHAKLREFGLTVGQFDDEDELDLNSYFDRFAETVSKQNRWEVLADSMVLGFFSFSKFLMYHDLDPDIWPEQFGLDDRPNIVAVLRDGFPDSKALVSDGTYIDDIIRPVETHHVVDADSSQTVVIAEAAGGRSLVVKGPPGTGKSQTITNIIAALVARGQRVLFVAEKMAALEVVHRRLQLVGLGPLTLELHSNKVSKRAVLEELKRTRDAQFRGSGQDDGLVDKLTRSSADLNDFARKLHTPIEPSGLSPQAILGRLSGIYSISAPTGFALDGADKWDQDTAEGCRTLVTDVAERKKKFGSVLDHDWRGVRCDALDPVDRALIGQEIQLLADLLRRMEVFADLAASQISAPHAKTFGDFDTIRTFMRVVPIPSSLDSDTIDSEEWDKPEQLRALLSIGQRYADALDRRRAAFNDVGIDADLSKIRAVLVTKGGGAFRFLSGSFRSQSALLRSYLRIPLPKKNADCIALVDQAIETRKIGKEFENLKNEGRVFGSAWQQERSDWKTLNELVDWRGRHSDLPATVWKSLKRLKNADPLEQASIGLGEALSDFRSRFGALVAKLDLDLALAFGVEDLDGTSLKELSSRLQAWLGDLEGLSRFISFATYARKLSERGASSLVNGIHSGELDHGNLVSAFDRSYAEILREALFKAWPELRAFDGENHNGLVQRFRQFDKARIALAREQIIATHAAGRPSGGGGLGPLGVLNAEIAKKRSHLPIRVLLEKAGPAVQRLKPVFMMSPLSVAQFLKPGGMKFDVLVMDEASQIEPVDALGSIARTQQIIVVGDERQLPPTAFFRKLTGENDEEDDESIPIRASDAESILELCLAKGMPYRMLEWHYRSKHQSLIAVSNREFYENKLFIVPSPFDAAAGMGLKFNLLTDSAYDRGETRTNRREAQVVAQAVINHARTHPDQSLGVATFSVAQRQIILKELELLRRANPDTEGFFSSAAFEAFFVKNLENIQGDERDVIFISIGYGKTAEGYLSHNFGPLSSDGGERRLNVLISRARIRCEIFCNFTGADIDLERSRARGVACLKLFLTFAETGHFGLGEVSGEDFDSEFEMQVFDKLRTAGYDVKRQIGASGFRVDLAISDPDKPGRFLLGIECDGAQFHSSRSARDRDRLRQQVLEAHGWIIHRIWSADWYLRPEAELRKIEAAIGAAKTEWSERDKGENVNPHRAGSMAFVENGMNEQSSVTVVVDHDADSVNREYYVQAEFMVNRNVEPHEVLVSQMANYIVKVVEAEGPIHFDEIVVRIRDIWGLARAGARIRSAVKAAVDAAVKANKIEGDCFYKVPGREIIVRNRANVASRSLRSPEMLPPEEIKRSLIQLVRQNYGATRNELVQASARNLGFSSTSNQLRGVIDLAIDELVQGNTLVVNNNILELDRSQNGMQ